MDASTIIALVSVVMSGLTTIFTLVLNYRTTRFTAEHNANLREFEIHRPKVYEALGRFTCAYAQLRMSVADIDNRDTISSTHGPVFIAAALELASLIDSPELQARLVKLARSRTCLGYIDSVTVAEVEAVTAQIAAYLGQ